jgi:hypothetical protein
MEILDIDALIAHFGRPLPADRRDAFCQAAEDALSRLHCPGPGLVHRTLAELLGEYFVPVGNTGTGSAHQHRRRDSKLASATPLA